MYSFQLWAFYPYLIGKSGEMTLVHLTHSQLAGSPPLAGEPEPCERECEIPYKFEWIELYYKTAFSVAPLSPSVPPPCPAVLWFSLWLVAGSVVLSSRRSSATASVAFVTELSSTAMASSAGVASGVL